MNTKLYETKNNLPANTRSEMINLLNQNLADILDLQLQAKHAHWNVKGPGFFSLHELFDKVAEELEGSRARWNRPGHRATDGGELTAPRISRRLERGR
jgi:hypothetical protein